MSDLTMLTVIMCLICSVVEV